MEPALGICLEDMVACCETREITTAVSQAICILHPIVPSCPAFMAAPRRPLSHSLPRPHKERLAFCRPRHNTVAGGSMCQ